MEYSIWSDNNGIFDMAYQLGRLWFQQWSFGTGTIGWFFPLFSCAVCLFIAQIKSRSRLIWGVVGFILPFLSAVALLFFPDKSDAARKPKKAKRRSQQEIDKVMNMVTNSEGEFEVTMEQFASSQKIDAHEYVVSFLPSEPEIADPLVEFETHAETSPQAGTLPKLKRKELSALQEAVAEAAFSVSEKDTAFAKELTELFIHRAIGEGEYIKAIASIAYNDGKNIVNLAKKDIYGALVYQNETHKLAAELATLFFSSHCASEHEVNALYDLHCDKLP